MSHVYAMQDHIEKWLKPHLTLCCALAVSPDAAAGAATGVPGARRFPGALSGGPVVVEMPAA